MQGKQRYNQALFVSLDLDQFVPQDHRLRKIDHVIATSTAHRGWFCYCGVVDYQLAS